MGGTRYTKREPQYDSEYLTKMNNLSSGNFANSTPTTVAKPGQFVKTKQGIFNGAFGSVAETSITIVTGVLTINANSTGSTVVRRVIFVTPNGATAPIDTLDHIDVNENELPYQELILLGTAGNTITISHDNTGASTSQRAILCPGDTDYTLTGDEAVYLIYNTVLSKWIITSSATSSGADNLGNHTATEDLKMGGFDITNFDDIIGQTGDKYFFDGVDTYMQGSTVTANRISIINGGVNVSNFLTTGFSTTNITCADITTTGDIDIDGNYLYLDSDRDTIIESSADDQMNFWAGGSIKGQFGNNGLLMSSDITFVTGDLDMGNGDIIVGTGDVDFSSGGTVDFAESISSSRTGGAAAALPANPVGYLRVELLGFSKYIPYYN